MRSVHDSQPQLMHSNIATGNVSHSDVMEMGTLSPTRTVTNQSLHIGAIPTKSALSVEMALQQLNYREHLSLSAHSDANESEQDDREP